jgi:hypothetical protein
LLPFKKAVPRMVITALLVIQFILTGLPAWWILEDDRAEECECHYRCGCPKEAGLSHRCSCSAYGRKCCRIPTQDSAPEESISEDESSQPVVSTSGLDSGRSARTFTYVSSCPWQEQFKAEPLGKSSFIAAHFTMIYLALSMPFAQVTHKSSAHLFLEPPVPPPEMTLPHYTLFAHNTE